MISILKAPFVVDEFQILDGECRIKDSSVVQSFDSRLRAIEWARANIH